MTKKELTVQLYLSDKTEAQIIERLFLAAIINNCDTNLISKIAKAFIDMRDIYYGKEKV